MKTITKRMMALCVMVGAAVIFCAGQTVSGAPGCDDRAGNGSGSTTKQLKDVVTGLGERICSNVSPAHRPDGPSPSISRAKDQPPSRVSGSGSCRANVVVLPPAELTPATVKFVGTPGDGQSNVVWVWKCPRGVPQVASECFLLKRGVLNDALSLDPGVYIFVYSESSVYNVDQSPFIRIQPGETKEIRLSQLEFVDDTYEKFVYVDFSKPEVWRMFRMAYVAGDNFTESLKEEQRVLRKAKCTRSSPTGCDDFIAWKLKLVEDTLAARTLEEAADRWFSTDRPEFQTWNAMTNTWTETTYWGGPEHNYYEIMGMKKENHTVGVIDSFEKHRKPKTVAVFPGSYRIRFESDQGTMTERRVTVE